MAILKYLGIAFYAALAARAETEKTPLVPLVSIRELHEDFSGKVEDAECERKPELVNSHEDVLVVAGECEGYKDFVVAAEMSTAARERGAEPAFPALYDPRFVKSDDTLSWRRSAARPRTTRASASSTTRARRRASTPSRTSTRCWTRLPLNATRCRPIH